MIEKDLMDEFRRRLLQQREALLGLKEAGEEATKTVVLDQTSVGRLSRMDAMQAQAMSEETVRRRQIELQNISAALKRIESDEYGYCAGCGEDIAIERLRFSPSASLCIACAEKADQA